MSALGLDAQAISKLTKALHVHGLTQTDSILSTRKFLDSGTIQSGDSGPSTTNTSATPHQSADWAPARRHHCNCTTSSSACWGRLGGGGDKCGRSRSPLLTRRPVLCSVGSQVELDA